MRHDLTAVVVLGLLINTGETGARPLARTGAPPEPAGGCLPLDEVPHCRDGLVDLVAGAFALSPPHPLTPALAADRLESALRRTGASLRLPPYERLIALGPTGRIADVLQGSESDVTLSREFDEPLHVPGAGIILIHNHPGGSGLAAADLDQLSKPGVDAVVAIGNDGSLYMASADPRHDPRLCRHRFLGPLSELAESEVQRRMAFRYALPVANPPRVHIHLRHVAALALQHAGAMQYRATLSDSRQQSYGPHRRTFLGAAEATAGRLVAALERHICQGQWQRPGCAQSAAGEPPQCCRTASSPLRLRSRTAR